MTASTYAGNAGAGIVPATVARTYQVVDGTTNGPNFSSAKVKLSDYLRGGTVYWTGSFPTTATPAGRSSAPTRATSSSGPFQQQVYRIGNATATAPRSASSSTASSTLASGSTASPAWRPRAPGRATTRRTRRPRSYVDNLDIFILPVVNPDGAHYSFYDNSVQRKNMTNYCPVTARAATSASRNTLGRRPQPQQRRSARSSTATPARLDAAPARRSPARPRSPSRRSRTSTGSSDTFPNIKFANNIHSYGGYFMWAPGAYKRPAA